MSMSRKDFADLAAALRAAHADINGNQRAQGCHDVIDELALDIASICAKHNERFDRARFLDACQLGHAPAPRKKVA